LNNSVEKVSAGGNTPKIKFVGIGGALSLVIGLVLAWLTGNGFLPFLVDIGIGPAQIITGTMLLWTILTCCTAALYIGAFTSRIPDYGQQEMLFKAAKSQFEDGEWQEALEIFKVLMGPEMNHKRALYYGALCATNLDDIESAKIFCQYYLKMQPRDKEVWEMLANSHKKLFEYEQAEDALEQASKL